MNKIIKYLTISTFSAILAIGIWGCATKSNLAPNGVYNGDPYLYNIDQTIVTTYDSIDQYLVWETENQTFVKTNLPLVFTSANIIRKNAPKALSYINQARTYYVNLKGLTNATFAQFQQATNQLNSAVSLLTDQKTNIIINVPATTSTNTIQSILGSL